MRKSHLLFSFVIVLALMVGACAAPAAPAAPVEEAPAAAAPAEAVPAGAADPLPEIDFAANNLNPEVSGEFSYWNGFTAADRPVMEENVATFDALYPNVTVNMDIQPWDSLLTKLLPSLRTGSDPDLVTLAAPLVVQYANADALLPIDELWAEGGLDRARFSEGALSASSVGGTMYGAPVIYFTTQLYMNNDLFEAAGLPATCPATTEEWYNALKTLTIDENGDGTPEQYGMSWGDHAAVSIWPSIVWSNGGDFVSADGTTSMLDDPKTIEAVQAFADMIVNDKILALGLAGDEADVLFATGKAAMTVSGPWVTTGFNEAGVNYQICQMPEGPAGRFSQGDGVFFVVNKNTQAKDAVYEMIKFWQTDWAQINWSSKTGFPPTRVDLADNEAITSNPNVAAFAEGSQYARTYLPGVVEFTRINDEIIVPAILEVARGNMTAEESLTAAAAEMNELLAEQ